LRAIVACGWFGIQTWIGGAAIYTIVLILLPGVAGLPALMPDWVGVHWVQFACFMLFLTMNITLIWKGINSIKVLEHLAAPFLLLRGLLIELYNYAWFIGIAIASLAYWAMMRGHGMKDHEMKSGSAPQDFHRQYAWCGGYHSERKHHGRYLRQCLSGGRTVRAGMRQKHGRTASGKDRQPATSCH